MRRRVQHSTVPLIEEELAQIEKGLIKLQRSFATKLDELHQMYSLDKNLQAFGIESKDVRSWASVCRKFNWRAGGTHHHSAVKRNDPALHIFLHKCVFNNACSLDKVTYI